MASTSKLVEAVAQNSRPKLGLQAWLRAARVHQWPKNLLVFAPLVASPRSINVGTVKSSLILFFAFSSAASAMYVINDLFDLAADREHPTKCSRPLAKGDLSVFQGLILIAAAGLATIGLAAHLPPPVRLILGVYLALGLSYSLFLKEQLVWDVLALAGLYLLRIAAGSVFSEAGVPEWIIPVSFLLFLSLAICKRCSELINLSLRGQTNACRRFYKTVDLQPLAICGICVGILSVVSIALFIRTPEAQRLYASPRFLYLLCSVLVYWVLRVWVLAIRGALGEDPFSFAIKDRTSYLVAVVAVAILQAATFANILVERFLR